MKKLNIVSYRFKDKKLIVDDDIYDILKEESILCFKNGNIHTIRIGRPYKIPSENLDILIIPHNPKTHGFKFLNGNDFDRRRCNLELIRRNTIKVKTVHFYQNKYKGVYFCKKRNMYLTNITINNKTCYLGGYKIHKDAALIYDAACRYAFPSESCYINIADQQIELPKELKNKINMYNLKKVS